MDGPPITPDVPDTLDTPDTLLDASRPSRQLVLCCDGTNNTLTAGCADTHVLRVYEHLLRHPAPGRALFYDPGVGSPSGAPPTGPFDWLARTGSRLSDLASGRGVYANISEGYRFLMRHWRDADDQIFLFGFSRGAFTARCIAGMVNLFGIIEAEHEVMLPTLIHVYFSLPEEEVTRTSNPVDTAIRRLNRALTQAPVGRAALARQIRDDFARGAAQAAWIHFIGVWDTVESVGLPGPLARNNRSSATMTDKRYHHVRHALSLDEHRWTFAPRLYDEPGDVDQPSPRRTLKQRCFGGVHCDVGGGYSPERAGLGEATLVWMLDEAIACGLLAPPLGEPAALAVGHDALFDNAAWALGGMCLRNLRPLSTRGEPIVIAAGPTPGRIESVWQTRRPLWPVAAAVLLGAVCEVRARLGLQGAESLAAWRDAVVGVEFAAPFAPSWEALPAAPVVWAILWHLGFVGCAGYLLARIASRSFARLAGRRAPDSGLPAWRWLGFMPLLAVGGAIARDAAVVLTLLARGLGAEGLATLFWWLGQASMAASLLGLIGCLPLVAVRLWIALPGVPRWPSAALSA